MKRMLYLLLAAQIVACGSPTAPTSQTIQPGNTTAVVPVNVPIPTPATIVEGSWGEIFNTQLSAKWRVSDGAGLEQNMFYRENVDLTQGALGLRMIQQRNQDGSSFTMQGAEVQSVEKYGFGVYTFVARMSSTATSPDGPGIAGNGQTSGMFVFSAGRTEIDFEQEGGKPEMMHQIMYHNGHICSLDDAFVGASIYRQFHTYQFNWTPDRILWLIDGQQVSLQTRDVPQEPGYVMINHWGVAQGVWGGTAMLGTPLWMWIRSFSFTPLE